MVSLHLKDLVKRFDDVTAVDGVNIEIEMGELFFLLGPSGC
ncbi:MAG: glycerol-3-phosphate ABC transporter ATP-binding protein, partial [Planctomycetota bacterium]|nr:glycerol-3-phosphate ABC transporter ATP-binding protein [Planctomycetota bacterium]